MNQIVPSKIIIFFSNLSKINIHEKIYLIFITSFVNFLLSIYYGLIETEKPTAMYAVGLNSRYIQGLIPVWQLDYPQLHLNNRDAPY
jgi:hypothetical protein